MKFKFTMLALILISVSSLQANDLSIFAILPNNLEVCKSASFGLIIENIGTDTTKDVSVQFEFTTGVNYDLNSVNGAGATELNISNLNQPIFSIPKRIFLTN